MFKAAIWDVEGTIGNTELILSKALEKLIIEKGGIPVYTEQGLIHVVGSSSNMKKLVECYGWTCDREVLRRRRKEIYIDLLSRGVTAMPGLKNALDVQTAFGIRKAIASSAGRAIIDLILRGVRVDHHFEDRLICSMDDVSCAKPEPDVYLLALKRLGLPARVCFALEDTNKGLRAAKDAGIATVAVRSKYSQGIVFENADLVINSLEELTYQRLTQLYKKRL